MTWVEDGGGGGGEDTRLIEPPSSPFNCSSPLAGLTVAVVVGVGVRECCGVNCSLLLLGGCRGGRNAGGGGEGR